MGRAANRGTGRLAPVAGLAVLRRPAKKSDGIPSTQAESDPALPTTRFELSRRRVGSFQMATPQDAAFSPLAVRLVTCSEPCWKSAASRTTAVLSAYGLLVTWHKIQSPRPTLASTTAGRSLVCDKSEKGELRDPLQAGPRSVLLGTIPVGGKRRLAKERGFRGRDRVGLVENCDQRQVR